MYQVVKPDISSRTTQSFDELDRVNYIALFEVNGHVYSGDVQLIMEDLANTQHDDCEVHSVNYSYPAGFVYVGLVTEHPEKVYEQMLGRCQMLPGQLSFLGIVPYDGADGEACDNKCLQALGRAAFNSSIIEEDAKWVIDTYAEQRGADAEEDMDAWRTVIGNCMFNLGISELGETMESHVHTIDSLIESGELDTAVRELLDCEVRAFVMRVLIYFSILQDLRLYVDSD